MLELLNFQRLVQSLKKDGTNPHFKMKYATINAILNEVKPKLSDLNLVLLQPIRGGKIYTEIWGEKGLLLSTDIELPTGLTPQQLGSAITYFRRYSLVSLFALEVEDDDANEAMKFDKAKPASAPSADLTPLTPEIIAAMQKAVAAGRVGDVEKRLTKYTVTEEERLLIFKKP